MITTLICANISYYIEIQLKLWKMGYLVLNFGWQLSRVQDHQQKKKNCDQFVVKVYTFLTDLVLQSFVAWYSVTSHSWTKTTLATMLVNEAISKFDSLQVVVILSEWCHNLKVFYFEYFECEPAHYSASPTLYLQY